MWMSPIPISWHKPPACSPKTRHLFRYKGQKINLISITARAFRRLGRKSQFSCFVFKIEKLLRTEAKIPTPRKRTPSCCCPLQEPPSVEPTLELGTTQAELVNFLHDQTKRTRLFFWSRHLDAASKTVQGLFHGSTLFVFALHLGIGMYAHPEPTLRRTQVPLGRVGLAALSARRQTIYSSPER